MRYLDGQNRRLIYVSQQATPAFWDAYWTADQSLRQAILKQKDTFVSRTTRKYLEPEDGTILEGGCGIGIQVAALMNAGYKCIGVDYATQTVQLIQETVPELDIRLDDVRHLDFEDGFFAGYWSLGVIEHSWDGYTQIGLEMARVVRPNGYLFLAFPYMSPFRTIKAKLNRYPKWTEGQAPLGFYQFALDHKAVLHDFEAWGFELVRAKSMLGLRAMKDEIAVLRPLLEYLYDYKGACMLTKGIGLIVTKALTPLSGHQVLLVLRKK
jgi:SAM-dependent methyltransferase